MIRPLPLYHEFYDRLLGAPWQAQPAADGKAWEVLSGYGCGCMALGETVVGGLPRFDARAIAAAPEAYALILRMARHLDRAGDPAARALADEARALFADLDAE